jgi:hypothetical protein
MAEIANLPFPSSIFLPANITNPYEAYDQFVQQCDAPEQRTSLTNYFAYTFFIVYAIGVPLQLSILPANARLAKHRSAFLLLLFIVRKYSLPYRKNTICHYSFHFRMFWIFFGSFNIFGFVWNSSLVVDGFYPGIWRPIYFV